MDVRRVTDWLEKNSRDAAAIAVLADMLAQQGDAELIRAALLQALGLRWEGDSAKNRLIVEAMADYPDRTVNRVLRGLHGALRGISMPLYDEPEIELRRIRLGDACLFTAEELLDSSGVGEITLRALMDVLKKNGLTLRP